LQHFPQVYEPPTLYGGIVMEPMGLLPLVAGYGSVLGVVWLGYFLWRNFPRRQFPMRLLIGLAALILLFMSPPDLIPAVVALCVFLVPRRGPQMRGESGVCDRAGENPFTSGEVE